MNHAMLRVSRRQLIAAAVAAGLGLPWDVATAHQGEVAARVAAMSLSEQAARMFMFPLSGTMLTADEEAWLRDLKPGGVILVQHNFGSEEDVRDLVAAIHATNPDLPPLVALDQEGGIVSRIADDPAPDAAALGLLSPVDIAGNARLRGEALARYGFDVNFAPVADVAFGPDSFMSGRTFGSNPAVVADDVVAYLAGAAETPVLHCVKHFPGHGRVSGDSHEILPAFEIAEEQWFSEDALPFKAAIDAGVPMVMLGHLVASMWDALPATLSPETVRVLRDELGFGGVVVTDDLFMGALDRWGALEIVDLAVAAGVDLLLYVGLPDAPESLVAHLVERVEGGDINPERLAASATRLLAMQPDRVA